MTTSRTSTVAALFLVGFTTCCAAFTVSTTSTPILAPSPQPLQAHARRTHTYSSSTTSSSSSSNVQTVFHAMDKDGNGKIDASELVDYLVQRGPYTKAVAQSIFEHLDVRHNGHLGLDELEQAMKDHNLLLQSESLPSQLVQPQVKSNVVTVNSQKTFAVKTKLSQNKKHHKQHYQTKKARQLYLEQAKQFFQAIDANHDGVISIVELKEHFLVQRMQAVAQSTGLMIRSNTHSSSNNKSIKNSKSVAWHHSEAAIQKLFDVLDVNADGRITLTELRDAFVRNPSVRHAFQAS